MKATFLSVVLFFVFMGAQAQTTHHYVVVGAFEKMDNAVKFTDKVNKMNFNSQYAVNPARNLYYVFILDSENQRQAFAFLMKIRVETEFKQAWVFSGVLGSQPAVAEEKAPVTEQPTIIPTEKPQEIKEVVNVEPEPVVEKKDSVVAEVKKPEGKPFFFKLTNGVDGNSVKGEIHVTLTAKASEYQAFAANEIVYLPPPPRGVLQITTIAPGFKEMKRAINYNDPSASASETGPHQEAIIALPLVRVRMGDYIEFTNVRFFANASLLQPESKNELDGLADLLKENTKYKIMIHGHCNGDKSREIISKGASAEFFALNESNARENGSAKKLTEYRAETVKEYLVSQGIDAKRISVRGEGGKQYIYPVNGTLASRNDRIEVEIKKGK